MNLLTVEDLQKQLGIGRTKAYALITSGEIEAFRIGRKWKITEDALQKYILSRNK